MDDRTRLDLNLGDVSDVIDAYLDRRPVYVIGADSLAIQGLLGRRYRIEGLAAPLAPNIDRVTGRLGAVDRP